MICDIREEPKGQIYKELIKYALKKSDIMMFVIRRDRYIYGANYDGIKRISNILNVDIQDIENNYMFYIENRYEDLYKNYKFIFSQELNTIKFLTKIRKVKTEELIKERLILRIEAELEGRRNFVIKKIKKKIITIYLTYAFIKFAQK